MIDKIVDILFRWDKLRDALFAEVHFYDQIDAAMNEPTTNLSWKEGDLWYGYTYNEQHRTYLFDDIGHEELTDLWDNLSTRDMEWGLMYR